MAFPNATNVDARGSTFNEIGRDVYNIHIEFSGAGSSKGFNDLFQLVHSGDSRPLLQGRLLSSSLATDNVSIAEASLNVATALIVEIVHSIMSSGPPKYQRLDDVKSVLLTLKQVLDLSLLSVQAFKHTPLSETFSKVISREANCCCQALEELLAHLTRCRSTLSFTRIGSLWPSVWANDSEGAELAAYLSRLSHSRNMLGRCLRVIESASWNAVANGLRTGSNIRDLRALLNQRPESLQHLQVDSITVVDHLGRAMPVPTMFCTSWEDFHAILLGFCKDRIGERYIQQRDYMILGGDDDSVIGPSDLPEAARVGKIMEMSIIVREKLGAEDRRCPRCRFINQKEITRSGWFICHKCDGMFQIGATETQPYFDTTSYDHSDVTPSTPVDRVGFVSHSLDPQRTLEKAFFRRISVIPLTILHEPKPTWYSRKVRKGLWNRRGDHLTNDLRLVHAPPDRVYPPELDTHPDGRQGYWDAAANNHVQWLKDRDELAGAAHKYDTFVVYSYYL